MTSKKVKPNWIAMIFVTLTETSSGLRQKLWGWVYNKLASKDQTGKFVFMNYGYHDSTETHSLTLQPEDEPFRYYIQLYNRVVRDINLEDKDILEVGCGRGGGGSFVVRYKKPRSFTGIDLSETAIDWCKKHYPFKKTNWLQGVADALPVTEQSIDVVMNVESSHCYPSMKNFLSEVKRILRPNGYLAFCDLCPTSGIAKLEEALSNSGLRTLQKHEITDYVLNALDHISEVRDKQIATTIPALLRPAMRDFAAVKDTSVYNMLKTGQIKYFCYLLQK